jgi:two-component system, chemotaxis family, sensor histidine kinase and response regulator PixL
MAQDKEREVRLHFLVEAKEYLDTIESGSIGLGTHGVNRQLIDGILRAAHSIKGGAGMMGFHTLAQLAHRLEDFFKILKVGKSEAVDSSLETTLLLSVDCLRQVVAANQQGAEPDEAWLADNIQPIFDELHDRLGDPQPEDAAALLSEEVGQDMKVLLFETEVEGCLQRLEGVLQSADKPCLYQEFLITAQEFEGLGQMLELDPFVSLCRSVAQELASHPDQTEAIANLALSQWRRSQALVVIGQIAALPTKLSLPNLVASNADFESNLPLNLSHDVEDLLFPDTPVEMLTFDPAAQYLFSDLETISHTIEEPPKLLPSEAQPEIAKLPVLNSKFEKYVSPESKNAKIKEEVAPNSETAEQTIRIPVRQLAQLTNLFGELTIERNGLDLHLKRLRNLMGLLNQRVRVLEQANFRLRTTHDKVATKASTPVPFSHHQDFDLLEMDRYSDLHLVSQDIMETSVQIQEVYGDLQTNLDDTEKSARDINRTSKLMQNSITQLQMRPISDLVGRFSRALRDMELKYGKRVELKIRGGSTLIDRTVLESLSDVLLHLFRNAFDHGIEDPQTRQSVGKPQTGVIEIVAAYRGNQTAIAIRDDGRGIAIDKVRSKALLMGLTADEVERASEKELLELIFEPGFSTAEQITDLSGRGVGMDVVRTNLREIRGDIQVDTKLGVGTTFTITVPFTLSIVRVLLVESGGLMLAFPTSAVEEMLRLHPEMILSAAGKEVLNWEGFMVPLIRLNEWLQFAHAQPLVDAETLPAVNAPSVLMVAQGEDLVGIQIDRYWGEQEVTIRQVEGTIPMPEGFSGCTILGDGRVVPLVDAIALLSWIDGNRSGQLIGSLQQKLDTELVGETNSTPVKTKQKNTILVVDDSITVRRFLALTLEKAGYRVEQAKDGREALDKLQAGLAVQAAISDVEMPRLDGYGFLAQVKSDPNCQHIPIVMLTSRSGDKHRQLAMNLGASAYFSKPFKEQELLKMLTELTK